MFKEVKAGKQHLIIPRLDNLPKSILATETELLTRDKGKYFGVKSIKFENELLR